MNFAIIGPSGVGKGTHAASLSSLFHLRHVATGDLFRHNLQSHTALGILARKYMEQSELVPDELVDAMIEEWICQLASEKGALFDGFPRTADQACFLDRLLEPLQRALDAVIYLTIADEEIIQRLAGRWICRRCQTPYHEIFKPPKRARICDRCGGELYQRPDDSTDRVRNRLRIFHRTTGPVLEHYRKANKLILLNGAGSIAEVGARLVSAVTALTNRSARFATVEDLAEIFGVIRPSPAVEPFAARSLDIVLLGGPGSGKGTQAETLSRELRLPHIATGDLFRENLRRATELGRLAKTYMDRGELVPDDVTEAMVEERLARADTRNGFILDGFPRTLPQAEALKEMMDRLQRRVACVVYISVPDAAIVERLSGRLICRNCQAPYHRLYKLSKKPGTCDLCGGELYQRTDDNPHTVRARLATFHQQTEPLIDFYRQSVLLQEIDGQGSVAQVSARCLAAVHRFEQTPAPAPAS